MRVLLFLAVLYTSPCLSIPSFPDVQSLDTLGNSSKHLSRSSSVENDIIPRASRFLDCSEDQYNDLLFLSRTARNMISQADASLFVVSQGQVPVANTRFLINFGSLQENSIRVVTDWLDRVSSIIDGTRDNVDVYCRMRRSQCDVFGQISGYVSDGRRIVLCPPFWNERPFVTQRRKKAFDLLWLLLSVENPAPWARSNFQSLPENVNWDDRYIRPSADPLDAIENPYTVTYYVNNIIRLVLFPTLRDPSAPIFPIHRQADQLIPDSFIVLLRRRSNIHDHFHWIGLNLTRVGLDYRPLGAINGYRVRLTWNCIHQLIIFDPHVDHILQDARIEVVPANNDFNGSSEVLKKRQIRAETPMRWFVKMLTVDRPREPNPAEDAPGYYLEDGGRGVNIYILDGGIRISHGIFDGAARNFRVTNYANEPMDDTSGHGTHVGGIAKMNAMHSSIVNVKVLGAGVSFSDIIQAWTDITEEHLDFRNNFRRARPPDWRGSVVNMSWEIVPDYAAQLTTHAIRLMDNTLLRLSNAGVVVVASAGNADTNNVGLLCSHSRVICVAACNRNWEKWFRSNWGTTVDIIAPGEAIRSASNRTDTGYVTKSGTSMAAPAVAGVLAIYVGWEFLTGDSMSARRLMDINALQNAVDGFHWSTTTALVNTGIRAAPFLEASPNRREAPRVP